MVEYDPLEKEVKDLYRTIYLIEAESVAQQQIQRLLIEHKYGKGARDPLEPVDWGKVYKENKCPECGDIISLREQEYHCSHCGFMIPLNIYDKAAAERKKLAALDAEEAELVKKAKAKGFSDRRLDALMDAGINEGVEELKERIRKRELAQKMAKESRAGANIRRGGGLYEKK